MTRSKNKFFLTIGQNCDERVALYLNTTTACLRVQVVNNAAKGDKGFLKHGITCSKYMARAPGMAR